MTRFFSWLLLRPVLWALALIALSLLLWFDGPLVAFKGSSPFAPESVRLILIGLLAAAWCAYWGWLWIMEKLAAARSARAAAAMASAGDAAAAAPANADLEQEIAALSVRFKQAIDALRRMRKWGVRGKSAYLLPWYLFIGAPGSGKTTALLNSGLKFPLAGAPGGMPPPGGTEHCECWFTDDALLLDTAGRYTTHDSRADLDAAAWLGLLGLLKKYRKRRPVDGVIVVLSLADLLQKDEAARRRLALATRERIKELHAQLGIRFPIYVMVTKCDLLPGFGAFFAALARAEQDQVWGVTFPLQGADRIDDVLESFAGEFDALEMQLQARVLSLMQREADLQRRAMVYGFPQRFADIGAPLAQMLGDIFASTRYEEKPMLRGVYFASGTQAVTPTDAQAGTGIAAGGAGRKPTAAGEAGGSSYFIMQLLQGVIFREAALAGGNLRLERHRRLLQWGALAGMATVLVALTTLRLSSYSRNLDYVDTLQQRAADARKRGRELGAGEALPATLPLLDAVRALPTGYAQRDDGVPLLMRFGLYQGSTLGPAAIEAYQRLLQQALLPRLVQRLEEQLRQGATNNDEFLFEALRMYLMLGERTHFDAEALQAWFELDWKSGFPEMSAAQQASLGAHVAALLEILQESGQPLVKVDAALVEQARLALARMPLPQRMYARLRRDVAREAIAEFSAGAASGQGASLVLVRHSGEPLTRGVPGMYTLAGYRRFLELADQALADIALAGWVLGKQEAITRPDAVAETRSALRQLYFDDYIRQWDLYLADVGIMPFSSLDEGARLTAVLAGAESPLRKFLLAAARETRLDAAVTGVPIADTLVGGVKGKLDAYKSRLAQALGSPAPAPAPPMPRNPVDAHFQPLHELVGPPPVPGGPPPAPAPLDKMLLMLKDVAVYFDDAARARRAGTPMPPAEALVKIKREAQDKPQPLAAMLDSLDGIGGAIAVDSDRARLNAAWGMSAGPFCRQAIGGRYPLVRTAASEVTAEDFGRFFAPGGIIDDFFQKQLLPYVDMSETHWRWRPGAAAALGIPVEVLANFERAATIRDMFFNAGGKLASMRFELKPVAADAGLGNVLLEIDGQPITYAPNGAAAPVQFQVPSGKRAGLVRFETTPPGKQPDLKTEGGWAWLRMLDHAVLEPLPQSERFRLMFNLEGRKVQYELTASSVINPFRREALEQFRCPEQL